MTFFWAIQTHAQKEANHWVFGDSILLSFNTNSDTPTVQLNGASLVIYHGGGGTISDENGNLLFYTDFKSVYSWNHQLMKNGDSLLGAEISTQSGIVVPIPGAHKKYYVFTIEDLLVKPWIGIGGTGALRYSIIDMNRENGLGEVIVKNKLIGTSYAPKITAVMHPNKSSVWLITHKWNSNSFHTFLISKSGIDTIPKVYNEGTVYSGNKNNVPGEVISTIVEGVREFGDKMSEHGSHIHLAGGETADVGDLVRTIIVDSTVTARVRRKDIIETDIIPGDVIVGLSSSGKAIYENEYNGGMGSNGLTSARHDVFSDYLAKKYPETYDDRIPEDLVYSGKMKLTDPVAGTGLDAGKLVLSPTRTYAPVIKKVLEEFRQDIHGMIHCSGGAQTKVLKFVDKIHVIKDQLFPVPPLFEMIREQSGTDWKEMYEVFNMGHRMELYLPESVAKSVIEISESFNIEAKIIGKCEEHTSKALTIKSEHGIFEY